MTTFPPFVGKSTGLLTLCIGLLVVCREFHIWDGVDSLLFIPVILLTALLFFYVSAGRKVFVLIAILLSLINLWWGENALQTLSSGIATAAFIATFLAALTALKYVAATSPAIQRCGRFLSQQPPGRRYAALTVGGQMFGLLLNYGAISLLGSMTMANASLERNEEVRQHRVRRMLLAIQRGFISTLPWSPLSFAMVMTTTLIPGTSWAMCVIPGVINGAIFAGMGWLMDTLFKPKLSTAAIPARQITDSWVAVLPLGFLLMLLVVLVTVAYLLTGVRVLGLVIVIVPLMSIGWVAIQNWQDRPLARVRQWSAGYLSKNLSEFRSETVLLMMAGYIGTVASPILGAMMTHLEINLASLPTWMILVTLVWLMPLFGQMGMNPILAVALIAPLLPDAAQMGISPVALTVALTAGWILSGISSPFTATTILVGNFAGISSAKVGLRWNGVFTLVCGVILSIWVVLYASFA